MSPRYVRSGGVAVELGGGGGGVTPAYLLAPATVTSFSVAAQETTPQGITFSDDGTKMYVVGSGNDRVQRYNLSSAWDVTTAVFANNFLVSGQDGTPNDVAFSPDGTKMFVVGSSNDRVYRYDLSSAWDVTSATFANFFSVTTQDTGPTGVAFSTDGTKMYVCGTSSSAVHRYNLSSAWDVTSAVFAASFSMGRQGQGVAFSSDGTKMFVVVAGTEDAIYRYDLTAWDITTAVLISSLSVGAQDSTPNGVALSADGTKVFIVGASNDAVYRYAY